MLRPDASADRSLLLRAALRRDLRGPLTTILARTQRLAQRVWHSASLAEGERAVFLEDLVTIEAATRLAVRTVSEQCEELPGVGSETRSPVPGEA